MREDNTVSVRRPSRGRSVGLVAFLFGMTGRPVLPGTVMRALLADLGLSDQAARGLLSRMCRDDMLAAERHGRTVDYSLAGDFAVSFERIRDQWNVRPAAWQGHFFAVLFHVPEQHRAYRDSLRRNAVFAGFGVLQPGVLICPVDRYPVLMASVGDPPADARLWRTTLTLEPQEAVVAAEIAYDLAELAARYRSHIAALNRAARRQRAHPVDGPAALRAYVDVLQPVLVDTLREQALPTILLPADWPGSDLRTAIVACGAAFTPATDAHIDRLLALSRR